MWNAKKSLNLNLLPAASRFSQAQQKKKAPPLQRYVRSVAVDLDGVDAALGQAFHPQEGTVLTQLHTLVGEVVPLKQLNPIVLSVLGEE